MVTCVTLTCAFWLLSCHNISCLFKTKKSFSSFVIYFQTTTDFFRRQYSHIECLYYLILHRYSRKSLRVLGTVGEPINPEAWMFYFQVIGDSRCPIVDTFWQTETVSRSSALQVVDFAQLSSDGSTCFVSVFSSDFYNFSLIQSLCPSVFQCLLHQLWTLLQSCT